MGNLTQALREILERVQDGGLSPTTRLQVIRIWAAKGIERSESEASSDRCAECGQRTNYNGWENKATWAMALLIDNDQDMYLWARSVVKAARSVYEAGDIIQARMEGIAERIVTIATSRIGDRPGEASFNRLLLSQFLGDHLAQVEWSHVAKHYAESEE